jgi:hypothetical protein
MCPICCGFRRISSGCAHRSGRNYSIECIAIPAACCPDCVSRGLAEYDSLKKKKSGDHIYLQDRVNDDYRTFDTKTGEETTT